MANFWIKMSLKLVITLVLCTMLTEVVNAQAMPSLKEAFEGKFLIGTALNTRQITGRDTASMAIVKEHFNAVVAENCMKSGALQPREGQFDFGLADRFVALGRSEEHTYELQ